MSRQQLTQGVFTCFLAFFMVNTALFAQEVYGKPDLWFFWLNTYQFHPKWVLKTEFHGRFDNYFQEPEQLIFRPSVQYKYREQVHFSAGYSYNHTFPYGKYPLPAAQPEHNIWQQVTFLQQLSKVRLYHRLRLEERFHSTWDSDRQRFTFKKIHYSGRLRYRFGVRVPLPKQWFVQAFDEVWIRSSQSLKAINFDRNWFSCGVGYTVNDYLSISLNYLHQYIRHDDYLFERHHTAQLSIKTTIKGKYSE